MRIFTIILLVCGVMPYTSGCGSRHDDSHIIEKLDRERKEREEERKRYEDERKNNSSYIRADKLEKDKKSLETQLSDKNSEINQFKKQLAKFQETDKNLETFKMTTNQLKTEKQSLEGEKKQLLQKLNSNKEKIAALEKELADTKKLADSIPEVQKNTAAKVMQKIQNASYKAASLIASLQKEGFSYKNRTTIKSVLEDPNTLPMDSRKVLDSISQNDDKLESLQVFDELNDNTKEKLQDNFKQSLVRAGGIEKKT